MTTDLVDQQKAFAEHYVLCGGNGKQAAKLAGYAPGSAGQAAYRLLRLPHVQDEIRRQQIMTLRGRLASMAIGVVEEILKDRQAPAGVRLDAAKTMMDRAGICAARTPETVEDDRPLESRSIGDLEMVISECEEMLVAARERQRVIDAVPTRVPVLPDQDS